MSEPLPLLSADTVIRAFGKVGFEAISQHGSHIKLRNCEGLIAIVPNHREIARGTLHSILLQSGVSREQFMARCTPGQGRASLARCTGLFGSESQARDKGSVAKRIRAELAQGKDLSGLSPCVQEKARKLISAIAPHSLGSANRTQPEDPRCQSSVTAASGRSQEMSARAGKKWSIHHPRRATLDHLRSSSPALTESPRPDQHLALRPQQPKSARRRR